MKTNIVLAALFAVQVAATAYAQEKVHVKFTLDADPSCLTCPEHKPPSSFSPTKVILRWNLSGEPKQTQTALKASFRCTSLAYGKKTLTLGNKETGIWDATCLVESGLADGNYLLTVIDVYEDDEHSRRSDVRDLKVYYRSANKDKVTEFIPKVKKACFEDTPECGQLTFDEPPPPR